MKYILFKPKKGKTGTSGVMTVDVRDTIDKYEKMFPNKIFKELWKLE